MHVLLVLYEIYRKNIIFHFKKVQKSIVMFYVEYFFYFQLSLSAKLYLLFVFHNVLWNDSNSSLSSFLQLPLLASTSGDILEVFLVKHSLVCNQLGRFSFSSKTFRPDDRSRKTLSPTGQGPGFGQLAVEVVRKKFLRLKSSTTYCNIFPDSSNFWDKNIFERKICGGQTFSS